MRGTSVKLPEDMYAVMERAAAQVGQSPSQFIREAVLIRCALVGGEVTDELRAVADALRENGRI